MEEQAGRRAIMGALRCATASGRRLEELDGVLLSRMLALLKSPRAMKAVGMFVVLAPRVAILLFMVHTGWSVLTNKRRKARKQFHQRRALQDSPGGEHLREGDTPERFKRAPFKRRPQWLDLLRGESGWPCLSLTDIFAVVLTTYGSALVSIRTLHLTAALTRAQSLNQRWLWWTIGLQYPFFFAAQGALSVATSYFNERIVLQWTGTVTRKLHSLYFANMSYYRVISSRREVRVEDPDVRISSEVRGVCGAYTAFLLQTCNSLFQNLALKAMWNSPQAGAGGQQGAKPLLTSGNAWFGVWLMQTLPVVTASSGPLLLLTYLTSQLDPHWVQNLREVASSRYQQAITRIQVHIERVCALQGQGYELELLGRRLSDVGYWDYLTQQAWSGHNYVSTLLSSDFGCGVSCGQVAADFGTCLTLAGNVRAQAGPGGRAAGAASMPSAAVAESVGGLAVEPQVQIMTWVNFLSLFGLLPKLLEAQANAARVLELFARLCESNELAAAQAKDAEQGLLEEGGSAVAFEGVAVETPDGQRLVDGLGFRVGLGETLLIVGHNGAGKSSIMRCLCGLWPIPAGRIARPGGRGKQDDTLDMYYLPQKPINVIGSLSDQLTYPVRLPGGLPAEELRRWLRYVGLERLEERELGEGEEACFRNWDELLSLGEQQALSIARLLYHRPRFAILDECTSAVSKGLERRLFELTRALGIACITIAHRPALQEHHSRMLRLTGTLEKDGKGWQLEELPRAQSPCKPPTHCGSEREAHERIAAALAAEEQDDVALPAVTPTEARREGKATCEEGRLRSASSRSLADHESDVKRRWPSVLSRLGAVLRLGLGSAGERRRAAGGALALAGLACLRCRLVWECLVVIASARRRALVGDVVGVLSELFGSMLFHPLLTTAEHHFKMRSRLLCQRLGHSAESALLQRALGRGLVLRVLRSGDPGVPAMEDAMQRLAEVQDLFKNQVHALLQKALPLFLAAYMLPTLVGAGGPEVLGIMAGGVACVKVLQRAAPDRSLVQKQGRALQARFASLHARVMRIAEAVAFSGGGEDERRLVEPQLEALISFQKKSLKDKLLYDWLDKAFIAHIPVIMHRFLGLNFARKNIPAGLAEVSPAAASAGLLYDSAAIAAQNAQREATGLFDLWETLDGRMLRVLELLAAFDAAEAAAAPAAEAEEAEEGGCRLEVRALDLVTPDGACLAQKVDFDLSPGLPMLVTGPNGCGKSFLFCTLLGVAPASGAAARVALRGSFDLGRPLMAATQRIYLPLGTLGDQVCYPRAYRPRRSEEGRGGAREEDAMLGALRSTGLEHLLRREKRGWLAERVWEDVLSGGESQRLQVARIFYGRPAFALLDECTSMVASDAEEDLYHALFRAGITPLTLSQRLFMPALYKWELSLGAASPHGWSLARTREAGEAA